MNTNGTDLATLNQPRKKGMLMEIETTGQPDLSVLSYRILK